MSRERWCRAARARPALPCSRGGRPGLADRLRRGAARRRRRARPGTRYGPCSPGSRAPRRPSTSSGSGCSTMPQPLERAPVADLHVRVDQGELARVRRAPRAARRTSSSVRYGIICVVAGEHDVPGACTGAQLAVLDVGDLDVRSASADRRRGAPAPPVRAAGSARALPAPVEPVVVQPRSSGSSPSRGRGARRGSACARASGRRPRCPRGSGRRSPPRRSTACARWARAGGRARSQSSPSPSKPGNSTDASSAPTASAP